MSAAEPTDFPTPERIARAAGDWVARRDRGLSETEAAEFRAWLDADPRHAEEFERLSGAWGKLDSLLKHSESERLAVVEDVPIGRRLARVGVPLLAAASIAVAFVLLRPSAPTPIPPSSVAVAPATTPVRQNYAVERTARLEVLPDGSVVDLRGDSTIAVEFSSGSRRVKLTGEAFFGVAKDASRPFLVTVDSITVRALGTAFDVRSGANSLQVILTEGKVRLEGASGAPDLSPGQRATILRGQSDAAIDSPTAAELEQALSWRATTLVFDDTPLADVVAAFNRFNARKLAIADDSLRAETIGGRFRADNLDGALNVLRAANDISFQDTGGDLIQIRSAR